MMTKLRLLAYSVRYTRPRQLGRRLWLTAKRQVRVQHARRVKEIGPKPGTENCSLAEPLPSPLFQAHEELIEQGKDGVYLCLLNHRQLLSVPMQWHPNAGVFTTPLEKITLHYMEYLEAVDDALFAALVRDWIEQNPPYQADYWNRNWNTYALSLRTMVWMQQFALRQSRLDEVTKRLLLASLRQQLRFLVHNLETDLGGNHLLKNIRALLWAGRFFRGNEAAQWTLLGERLLAAEMKEQILADGLHYERSPAYHTQVFADLLECYQVMQPSSLHNELGSVLDKMAQALVNLTHPDGLVSLFNDGGLHMSYLPQVCLDIYAKLRDKAVPPAEEHFALAEAGYYGLRREQNLLLVDCGMIAPDFLPAHGHGDILAFEWSLQGERVVVDAGVYEYHAGKWRQYSRSTAAHNTVTVDGADQCEFWKAFRVGRRANVTLHRYEGKEHHLLLEGSHDGYSHLSGSPIHRRLIQATVDRIEVQDNVEGGNGQPVEARLLFHPSFRAEKQGNRISLTNGKVKVEVQSNTSVKITQAWWCPDFNIEQKAVQLVFRYGTAPCKGGFSLQSSYFENL
ncbi:MAG: alginate lyase family protein [Caldilineaceae bacterium]